MFSDFGKALLYPFKFKTSLILGALIFAIFSMGKLAINMGNIFLASAALLCIMIANSFTIGVLTNTVNNFVRGITDKNFFPSFDDFSMWEDVVQPFFLLVAIYVVCFGGLIAIGGSLVWSGIRENMSQEYDDMQEFSKRRGEASVKGRLTPGQEVESYGEEMTEEEREALYNGNMGKWVELQKEKRQKKIDEAIAKNTELKGMPSPTSGIGSLSMPIILLGILNLLWGLFYMPAAYAVAGYTQSFSATINPLIGFDTIKHLGADYFKLLGMFLLLLVGQQ